MEEGCIRLYLYGLIHILAIKVRHLVHQRHIQLVALRLVEMLGRICVIAFVRRLLTQLSHALLVFLVELLSVSHRVLGIVDIGVPAILVFTEPESWVGLKFLMEEVITISDWYHLIVPALSDENSRLGFLQAIQSGIARKLPKLYMLIQAQAGQDKRDGRASDFSARLTHHIDRTIESRNHDCSLDLWVKVENSADRIASPALPEQEKRN